MTIDITAKPGSSLSNKTGGWRTYIPRTDKERCISCGTCARVCPENCVKMIAPPFEGIPLLPEEGSGVVGGGGLKPETNYAFCKGCGVCASECPVKVITMELERK